MRRMNRSFIGYGDFFNSYLMGWEIRVLFIIKMAGREGIEAVMVMEWVVSKGFFGTNVGKQRKNILKTVTCTLKKKHL